MSSGMGKRDARASRRSTGGWRCLWQFLPGRSAGPRTPTWPILGLERGSVRRGPRRMTPLAFAQEPNAMIVGLTLLALVASHPPVSDVIRADGLTVSVTGAQLFDEGGSGTYQVLSKEGAILVDGEVLDGAREGRWVFRYPNGEVLAAGRYAGGVRVGGWRSGWRTGEKRCSGKFRRGLPNGTWTHFDPAGNRDALMSGELEIVEGTVDGLFSSLSFRAGLLDGEPHGECTVRWSDGSLLYSGAFVRGIPVGDHQAYLVGGAVDPGLTGPTGEGAWVPCPILAEPDSLGCVPGPAVPDELDVGSAVERLGALLSGVGSKQRARLAKSYRSLLDDDPNDPDSTVLEGARWAILRLATVEGAEGDSKRAEETIEAIGVLVSALGGRNPGWRHSDTHDLLQVGPRPLLRAHTQLALVAASRSYWGLDARVHPMGPWTGKGGAADSGEALLVEVPWASWLDDLAGGSTAKRLRTGKEMRRDRQRQEAIDRALEWLAKSQRADGSWSAQFPETGQREFDVGVTGLALVCFIQEGNTVERGPFKECVASAVRFLLQNQVRNNGPLRSNWLKDSTPYYSGAWIYEHAVATWALCESELVGASPALRRGVRDAIPILLQARNPYGVWRYAFPPDGSNDTSVTHWAIRALHAAERVGIEIDAEVRTAAISWVDQITDPGTGRVGYVEQGSPSARVPGFNDQYPTEKGEALTACGMVIRELATEGGRDPFEPAMRSHTELLMRMQPRWEPDGYGCDFYYWMIASQALRSLPAKLSKEWFDALSVALIPSQLKEVDVQLAGSWDPVGPWGYAGGRVQTTALALLALGSDRCSWQLSPR